MARIDADTLAKVLDLLDFEYSYIQIADKELLVLGTQQDKPARKPRKARGPDKAPRKPRKATGVSAADPFGEPKGEE